MNADHGNGCSVSLRSRSEKILLSGKVYIISDQSEVILSKENGVIDDNNIYFENEFAKFTLQIWNKGGETVYRSLSLVCKKDITLYEIKFCVPTPKNREEFVFYKTFINAPAAAFIRCGTYSFYSGIENPFFTAEETDDEIVFSYKPSLLLKEGELYESEPQFMGECKLSDSYVRGCEALNLDGMQSGRIRQRFFNPCDGITLNASEIKAMRAYVWEYYSVLEREFDNILYFFFYPKKQYPKTSEEISDYLDTIDRFKRLKGDIIAFNPMVQTTLPTDTKPYWELCPEGSAAEKIFNYAHDNGLRCGFYIGCGTNNEGGNSALLPFAPEKTEWKKRDAFGNVASENCLACDEYLDWWYDVQKNTIEKYELGYWAWDPGPGNGNDCFADNHGHIPGKGEYKGWRNSQRLLKRIRERFPRLFLQSFYGRKEYGIWGFRYFSQHEVYWEQTIFPGATLHTDFNDYRINAHGTRLQNLWSMNYRFLPSHIGHGLVTRMGEMYFDPTIEKANDLLGWKYSLLSAIACCGSVTHCNLPDRLENVPGMVEFYDKWIGWAKQNYRYCEYTLPISDNVENGVIDGFSRIDGKSGQIFLFNSSPLTIRKRLTLDEKIGITTDESFYLHILYCENTDTKNEALDFGGEYKKGNILEVTLPPYGALVVEMSERPGDESISKIPFYQHKIDRFCDSENNELVPFCHPAFDEITVFSKARFNSVLKDALKKVHVPNAEFIRERMDEWKKERLPFNLLSSAPDKLFLYIPFGGIKMPTDVLLRINGKDVRTETFYLQNIPFIRYAYIENHVLWDETNTFELKMIGLNENSFLGIYIGYPDVCEGIDAAPIVFDEVAKPSRLHLDKGLIIDSVEVSPDVIDDTDCEYTVTVKTAVAPELIDAVYCILPTQPSMPALEYNSEKGVWQGKFGSGRRRFNIFLNREIVAWIKSRDGGIGEQKSCEIKTRYVWKK